MDQGEQVSCCENGRTLTHRYHGGEQTEQPAGDHRAAGQPSPSPTIQRQSEEGIGRQLGGGSDREREEEIESQRADVSHVAIEHERDGHPDDDQQDGDVAQPWRLEQIQYGVVAISSLFLLKPHAAVTELLIHLGIDRLLVDRFKLLQDSDGFVNLTLRNEPSIGGAKEGVTLNPSSGERE